MRATATLIERRARRRTLFGVLRKRQSYLNLAYLLTAGPLGLMYAVVLLLLLGSSISLIVALVGLPLLVLTALVWWLLAAFERELTMWWLGVEVAPMAQPLPPGLSVWQRLQAYARNPVTWKSLLYLFLKLPYGVLAGALECALLAVAALLLTSPLWSLVRLLSGGAVSADSVRLLALSPLLAVVGALLLAGTLATGNLLAAIWGQLATVLLGMSDASQRVAEAREAAAHAQAQAAEAEQSRRELIVNVSHELRTPVASIRGHIESLLMTTETEQASVGKGEPGEGSTAGASSESSAGATGPPREELRTYLGIVQRETERLGALVEDLLALARGDAGELRLVLGPVDGAAVLEEVYAALAPLAKRERQVTLARFTDADIPPVWADRQRLTQVLLNLVRNAIVYTPAGGIVSLSLEPAGPSAATFVVADTGIGIGPNDLPHVFERFYRADASRARASGGFGLGLAIVRDLLEAMGGTIAVESRPGEGSTFRVVLRTVPPSATGA
ncbi:MAG TPA: ATP-binding protein [Ktedonobacterales bacterium]|nr:ATP-binding protein [Ktedonobacterales bacterium]